MIPSRLRTIALLLALLPAAAVPAQAAKKHYRISGAEKDADGKWQPVEELSATIGGMSFTIRFLEPEARVAAIRSVLSRDLDLLPGRVDERHPGYLVFLLEADNGTGAQVHFNPGQARLASDKGDMKFALDYSALYEVARRAGPAAPSFDEMAAMLFDRGVTIEPGGSVRKLLAFEAPSEDKYKTLEVQLVEVNTGSRGIDFVFPFRKFYE